MSITHETGSRKLFSIGNGTTADEMNELLWDTKQGWGAYNYKSHRPFLQWYSSSKSWSTNPRGVIYNGNQGDAAYTLGLTSSLYSYSGNQGTSWFTTGNIDVSLYVGSSSRIVCFYTSGTSFRGDAQIGWARLGGTTWTFESDAESWETTTANSTSLAYSSATFSTIANGSTSNRWNRDSGGTSSSSTALSGTSSTYGNGTPGTWYFYAETSGNGFSNKDFICRSPAVTVSSNTLELVLAGYGSNIGTFDVYLDVVA